VQAARGRALTPADEPSDRPNVAVISDACWRQRFGSDQAVVGRTVVVDGTPHTIVGVLPRDFVGPLNGAEAYFPLNLAPVLRNAVFARRSQWLGLVGRLKDDVTIDAA